MKSTGGLSLTDIVKEINTLCKKHKINPYELNRAKYYKLGGTAKEWDLRRYGGLRNIIEAHFQLEKPQQDLPAIIEMKEVRKAYERHLNQLSHFDLLLQKVKQAVADIKPLTGPIYKPKHTKSETNRIITVVLSDHHIGSDIQKMETGHQFGAIEEARALAYLSEQIINYKIRHRDETILNILFLGDIIENELHGRTTADLVHLQACRAIWLYPQMLRQLAGNFKHINVYFAVGNHGRDKSFHTERATALKFNALETTIYFAIRQAMSSYKNITFFQPTTPWVVFNLFEFKGYATHGDTHLDVGNPGEKINVAYIEQQINKINASLKDTEEYKVFVAGHVHQPIITQLTNGSYLILNGALVPPNSYAQSLNIMEAPQVQVLWEATPQHPVGDFRMINVAESATMSKLDKIIIPFKGL